ncbi:MAG TPA: hypothetical protein VHB79_24095 [Polyangiaceae bacterium]|nr:hypothetical protein [Polyangiaceae bacterium]
MKLTPLKQAFFGAALLALSMPAMATDLAQPKLITNFSAEKGLLDHVDQTPLERDVYDLSFAAYDEDFADEFGLEPSHVADMDEGLRFIEIRMVTEGKDTHCYYNLVLDKSVPLDFPKENYAAPFAALLPTQRLRLYTDKLPRGFDPKTHPLVAKGNLRSQLFYDSSWPESERFANRTYLGNRGYTFHTEGQAFRDGIVGYATPAYIVQDRAYTLVSLDGGCGATIWEHPEPALWFRKPGEKETHQPLLKSYHTFEVPPALVEQVRSVMRTFRKPSNPNQKGGN